MGVELPRVKVCGLTRESDLVHAQNCGADALGFVFHRPSPRHLELERMAELAAQVTPGTRKVLVVVSAEPAQAERWVSACGADFIQLCGDEAPEDWAGFPTQVLRRLPVAAQAASELEAWSAVATGFVLDHPAAPGGTGRTVDLELASQLARQAPCLLAGGLDPRNVARFVASVQPAGVDASSGLEREPGIKDEQLVQSFVEHARAALALEGA